MQVTARLLAAAVVGVVVLALAACSTAVRATGQAPDSAVWVWETTADRSALLTPQPSITMRNGPSALMETINLDPAKTYQRITGFGASFTDSAAWLVARSPQRDAIMTNLFDPVGGIGLNLLRQPIGASDFARSIYSYDDEPSGQADRGLADFSIEHDESYILPVLRQALAINPHITVMASPWSPPGWMKTTGSMIGGSLKRQYYPAFADYLVRFVRAYQAAGVAVAVLSPQNEPNFMPTGYPGSLLSPQDEGTFVADDLGPALQRAGLSTGIVANDINWDQYSFPLALLGNQAAAGYVSAIAWHCYDGDPSSQTIVHDAYPTKATYYTECSGSQSQDPANTFADTLDSEGDHLVGALRNWAETAVTWNVALDPGGGPSMGCQNCTGLVTVNNGAGTATYNAEYYALGQVSKFVKPGAVRIDSNTGGPGGLEDVAFRNPDGSTVLLVLNSDGSHAHTFGVAENNRWFAYSLPARAVATFVWQRVAG